MKAKYILLSVLCLTICTSAEAQILKKLKKKAEQAAERTILKKTDEIVTEKTEKTIDGATTSGDKNAEGQNINNSANSSMNPMASKKMDKSKLPDSYVFDWEFKTEMISAKGEKVQMNYLLNSNSKDYAGMEMSTEQSRQQGTIMMVMDSNANAITMFMSSSGQKMAQMTKMPDPNKKSSDEEFTYKEIGTKTILGYECFGIEVENKGYKATMYYTLDAPVTFSALFNFSKDSTPKGFDPALIEVIKEDALLMEMHTINKNKSKESFDLNPISLNKKDTTIIKGEYQFMGF